MNPSRYSAVPHTTSLPSGLAWLYVQSARCPGEFNLYNRVTGRFGEMNVPEGYAARKVNELNEEYKNSLRKI